MRTSGLFWEALNVAREANLAHDGEGPVVAGSAAMTRRRMLGAIVASAALPITACTPLPTAGARTRVAIIGGGLAGLIALRDLLKAGVDAKLYEARGRLGGRVSTYRSGPVPADDGGQFINGDHADILALAREHGLKLIDRKTQPGKTLLVDNDKVIDEARLAEDLRPFAAAIAVDAAALDANFAAAAPALDAISVSQYLDRHHNLLPAYVRKLMEATLRTEFGQEPAQASAIELIFNLPVTDGRHVRVIGSSDERYVLYGGSGTLVEALAPQLMSHVAMGHALKFLHARGDHVVLHFENGAVIEAERVIVTVPAALLRTIDFGGLLPPLWRQYVAEIDCGRNEKINAAYHGKPWASSIGASGDLWLLQGSFAEGWDATTVGGETGLMTFFMGGAQCAAAASQDAASLRHRFEAEAAPAVPGLTRSATTWQRRTNWSGDRFSRGAYSCFRPGQLTRYAPLFWLEEHGKATRSPVVGPLIFAGEHLSDAWPGYMNGGAQTGRLAAQAILGG